MEGTLKEMSSTHGCVCPSPKLAASFHGEASGCGPHGSVFHELLGRPNGPGAMPGASSLMSQGSAELWELKKATLLPSLGDPGKAMLTQQQVFQRSALRSHKDHESSTVSTGSCLMAQDGCLRASH